MAGFADIVRNGVKLADSLTASLQDAITYEPWIGNDGYGSAQYGSAQYVDALIEKTDELIQDSDGNVIQAMNKISFLRPINANGATGRAEPIDPRDKLTLPDGETGPIASVESFVDPSIGAGYFHVVYLGKGGQ